MNDKEFEAFRDSLCAAATRLVAREGISALTLRRLAAEMGCSRQTPYRYFRSKDELLEEVFVRCHDVFIDYCERAVESVSDPRERLLNIRDAYLKFAHDEPDAYAVVIGMKPPAPMPRVMEKGLYEHMRLRSFFDEAVEAGFVEGDSGSLAYLFWAAIDGLAKLQQTELDTNLIDVDTTSNLVEQIFCPAESKAVAERKQA